MADTTNPVASRELLDYLSRLFPDKCPTEDTPDRQVWIDAGAAKVVRKLRTDYDRQMKSLLENTSQ